jgi:pimeloyl-ACP methyl ester carboxylesterase
MADVFLGCKNTTMTSGYAPVNGINMYYEVHGEGDMPLVLIHGGGSTINSNFGVLLPLLAAKRKVIAVELQAHGRTGNREVRETFEQDADDVAALLGYVGVPKADILGFSNGGTTTLQIAMRHPEVVNRMIVISANYSRAGMLPGLFDNLAHATLDDMPGPLRDAYLAVTPSQEGLLAMFTQDRDRMLHFTDIPEEAIAAIKTPALLMVADQDVMTVEHVVALHRLIEGSRLVVLPGMHGSFIGEVCTPLNGSRMPEFAAMLIEEFLGAA